jgi:hypothetical protein
MSGLRNRVSRVAKEENIVRRIQGITSLLAFLILANLGEPTDCAAQPYLDEVEQFFQSLKAGEVDAALENLYASNPWIQGSQDSIQQLKSQLGNLGAMVGQCHDHILLAEKQLANRWVYLNYLVLFDRQPLRFEFQFYRPEETWVIHAFSFDDEIDQDLVAEGRQEAVAPQD